MIFHYTQKTRTQFKKKIFFSIMFNNNNNSFMEQYFIGIYLI